MKARDEQIEEELRMAGTESDSEAIRQLLEERIALMRQYQGWTVVEMHEGQIPLAWQPYFVAVWEDLGF